MSIESSYAIAHRIAGLNHPQTYVDASGHPVGTKTTMIQDAQLYDGDYAKRLAASQSNSQSSNQSSNQSTSGSGISGLAHAAVNAIGSMAGSSKDTKSSPAPVMTSNFGFPVQGKFTID
jgi:hypothetical protein